MSAPPDSSLDLAPNVRDVVVFKAGEGGSSHYRIPSIIQASDGSLVAFIEGRGGLGGDPGQGNVISIKSRRSTDNGQSWSDYQLIHEDSAIAFSDPRPLLDETTGKLFLFYTAWDKNCAQNGNCINFGDEKHMLLLKESNDNGISWSPARDIAASIKETNWYANGSDANSGRATWSITPSDSDMQTAQNQGWQLSWNSRVAGGACNMQYYADGNKRYLVDLFVDGTGQINAQLYSDNGHVDIDLGFDVSAYHDYKIVSDANSVRFIVDGIEKYAGWNGQNNSAKTITWGNGCSTTAGGSAYHSIEFMAGNDSVHQFDASLIKKVNGTIVGHPALQGWTKTGSSGGKGDPGWKSLNAGPGHGVQLKNQLGGTNNGRLIFPALKMDAFTQLSVVSVYSDDNGQTWQVGDQTPTYKVEPSEADLVELSDGRLLLSARNDGATGADYFNRYQYISHNGGESWQKVDETRESVNGALFFKLNQVDTGLLNVGNDRVLMSGPQGNGAVSSDRNDLAIWSAVEDSEGNYNFDQRTNFRDGFTAYSDLVKLTNTGVSGNENVGVIYEAEGSTLIKFMVIDIDDIK